GTDVIRVGAHAAAKGTLVLRPHVAKMTVTARGDKGVRTEQVTLTAPGTRSRVTPEESGIQLGDPVGFNVDVHAIGMGEMTLSLDDVEGADGLLVRVYRREELDRAEAQRRMRTIEEARREPLAAHAWELDWVDLGQDEQETILAARWRKIAAYQGTARDVRAHAIALAPPPARPHRAHDE